MKICVVTSSRADYGLLRPILSELSGHESVDMKVIVTGSHLEKSFGMTIDEIKEVKRHDLIKIPILTGDQSDLGTLKAISRVIVKVGKKLSEVKPDIMLILGDRFEILGCAVAAHFLKIPIAHLYGGEKTVGSLDDSTRHAITKLSNLHFVSNQTYYARVLQMGEDPDYVHVVGSTSQDNLPEAMRTPFSEVIRKVNFPLVESEYILCTYHPDTLLHDPASNIDPLLAALGELKNRQILFTLSNADSGGDIINKKILAFVRNNSDRCIAVQSLGATLYLKAASSSALVLGNSSSGIVEVPSLGVPTVNIGNRQQSRIKVPSIIDCGNSKEEILDAVAQVESDQFRCSIRKKFSPFGEPGAAKSISDILTSTDIKNIPAKDFKDLDLCNQEK